MTEPLDVEITLRPSASSFETCLRALLPNQDIETDVTGPAPIDTTALLALESDPAAYGLALGGMLFADARVYAAFYAARQSAEMDASGPRELRVRLRIEPGAAALHGLRWELLRDPKTNAALCTSEKLFFSRYLPGQGMALRARGKGSLRALAAVAAPSDLATYGLAEIDVEGELERAAAALKGVKMDRLPAKDGETCSLDALIERLRVGGGRAASRAAFGGYDVLYLVCHGKLAGGAPALALDDGSGHTVWVPAGELATRLAELNRPPRLVVLTACESAGSTAAANDALAAAGPLLVGAGIPAVVAMQGKVFIRTVAQFMPVFFKELARAGVIDQAMAVARGSIRKRPDWHAPVLFMRLVSGRLWMEDTTLPDPVARPIPHQIPPTSEDFVDRERELADLREAIETRGEPVVGISGMGGMGKTALALELAARLRDSYPAGQVYFDFGESAIRPALAADALAHILRTLQPQMQEPQKLADLKAAYQSLLFEQPVMILLDNARSEEQVAALLPPPRDCLIILTCWRRLDLPGLFDLSLGELGDEDAVNMLLDLLPQGQSRQTALALAQACGKLPQAIQVVAGLLRRRPDLTAEDLVRRMKDDADRLAFSGMDSLLQVSYDMLDPTLQAPWTQLAIFTGDFSARAAAWLWGLLDEQTPPDQEEKQVDAAVDRLGEMLEHSLLHFDPSTRRYQMYNLARVFAGHKLDAPARQAGVRLHACYYLRILREANDLFQKGHDQALAGLALFDRERVEISAAQSWAAAGPDDDIERLKLANQYAAYGGYCLSLRLLPAQQVPWLEAGLRAARLLNDRRFLGIHLGNMGNAIQEIKGPRSAHDFFKQQLDIARSVKDDYSQINALSSLGLSLWKQGRPKAAIPYYRQGLKLARKIKDRGGEARALGNLGVAYHDIGKSAEAVDLYERQLAIARQIGDLQQESNALNNLGIEYAALGDPARAQEAFNQALSQYKKLDDRAGYGRALDSLASLYRQQGSLEQARQTFNDAIRYQQEAYDRQGVAISQWNLGELLAQTNDLPRAVELMQLAIEYELEIKHPDAVKHQKRLKEVQAQGKP